MGFIICCHFSFKNQKILDVSLLDSFIHRHLARVYVCNAIITTQLNSLIQIK